MEFDGDSQPKTFLEAARRINSEFASEKDLVGIIPDPQYNINFQTLLQDKQTLATAPLFNSVDPPDKNDPQVAHVTEQLKTLATGARNFVGALPKIPIAGCSIPVDPPAPQNTSAPACLSPAAPRR
jgi:hypothetical protein